MILYELCKFGIQLIAFPFFRLRVFCKWKLPKDSGYVVAMNHAHFADPIYFIGICPVTVHFLAKKELFANPLSNWFMRSLAQIPVDRQKGGNTDAFAKAVEQLKAGKVVAVFPEGTRRKPQGDGWMKGRTGAARMAALAGVPLVPVLITNNKDALGFTKEHPLPRQVNLLIFKPVDIKGETHDELQEDTDRYMACMRKEAEKWLDG